MPPRKKYNRDEIANIMRSVGKEHLAKKDVDALPNLSSSTVIREFGSWSSALQYAGLQEGIKTGRPIESKLSFADRYSWKCMLGPMSKDIEEHKAYSTWTVHGRRHVVFFRKLRDRDSDLIRKLLPFNFHYLREEDVDILKKRFVIQRARLPSVYLDLSETLDLRGRSQKSIRQKYNRIDKLGFSIESDFRDIEDIKEFVKRWSGVDDLYADKYFRNLSGKNVHFFRNYWHKECICSFIYGEKLLAYGVLSPPNKKGFSNYILGKALYADIEVGGLSEYLDLSLYMKGFENGVRYVNLGASFSKDLKEYKNKFAGRNEFNEFEGKVVGVK